VALTDPISPLVHEPVVDLSTGTGAPESRPDGGRLLDPGFNLTLRPMRYPQFYDMYRDALKNTWMVEEIDFSDDLVDLDRKLVPAERHMINRLVAFFATGDSIVSNNLVLNLYKHVNSPEGRMYLSRQLFEEALHVQFYLTLLDTYIPDHAQRAEAFAAIENIPSIRAKAEFCFTWIDSIHTMHELRTREDRQEFLLNLICFAACIEGLFFFAAFAYVYFLRDKGLLNGLAAGTNWVFRDESGHMNFAFEVINQVRDEEPDLFDAELGDRVTQMIREAVDVEYQFAEDLLSEGIPGMSLPDTREYLQFVADTRLAMLQLPPVFGSKNPFNFMALQDVQELTNFFERRVSAYSKGIEGEVDLHDDDF
jgi:ribonucleoside-diphosphate reductase beta chain